MGEGHRNDFHRGSFEGHAIGDDPFIDQALLKAEEQRAVAIDLQQLIASLCATYRLTVAELRSAGKTQPWSAPG